jgi:O-antigen ligase
VLLVLIGLFGLVLAKAVGAIMCLGVVLVILLSRLGARGNAPAMARLSQGLLGLAVVGTLAFGAIQFLRPYAVPTSDRFRDSNTYHRIVVGYGGLELFSDSPIVGLGWRRSDSPEVIANSKLGDRLRERFGPDLSPSFFPDVNQATVHNMYVQLLAELGVLGIALLAFAIGAVGQAVLRLTRSVPPGELQANTRFMALGSLAVLVWMNDNPLYGGQPETITLAVLVGALAAVSRMVRDPRAQGARSAAVA